jgi:hypothetical protein
MWVGGGHLFEAGGFLFAFLRGFETGGAVGVDGAFSEDVGSSAGCGGALGLANYSLLCIDRYLPTHKAPHPNLWSSMEALSAHRLSKFLHMRVIAF